MDINLKLISIVHGTNDLSINFTNTTKALKVDFSVWLLSASLREFGSVRRNPNVSYS